MSLEKELRGTLKTLRSARLSLKCAAEHLVCASHGMDELDYEYSVKILEARRNCAYAQGMVDALLKIHGGGDE